MAVLCQRFNRLPSEILAEPAEVLLDVNAMLTYAEAHKLVHSRGEAPAWAQELVFDVELEKYERRKAAAQES